MGSGAYFHSSWIIRVAVPMAKFLTKTRGFLNGILIFALLSVFRLKA